MSRLKSKLIKIFRNQRKSIIKYKRQPLSLNHLEAMGCEYIPTQLPPARRPKNSTH